MKKNIYFFFILLLLLSSCGLKYKTIPYFTDLPADNLISQEIRNQTILHIQKDDILAITVTSLDEEASAIFNMGNTSSVPNQTNVTSTNPIITANGFIVDQNGNIQLPYIGSLKVEGLTTAEARALILTELNKGQWLKEPVVSLRLVNFKISVLGDVARPGVYPVQNERVTVIEALGMAGDLNITALRNNVLLLRETQGQRLQVRLNLQSKELFTSPYYYMQNNDVLVVTPGPTKYASVDASYRNVSLIISALSVIALLITRL